MLSKKAIVWTGIGSTWILVLGGLITQSPMVLGMGVLDALVTTAVWLWLED